MTHPLPATPPRPRRTANWPPAAALAVALAACGGSDKSSTPPPPPNTPPTIQAPPGLSGAGAQRSFTLAVDGAQVLEFTASDADGDGLQWLVQAIDGDAAAAGVTFPSPWVGATLALSLAPTAVPTAVLLTVLVEDPYGAAAAIDLRLVRSGPPVLLSVAPDSAFAAHPQQVMLRGSALSLGGTAVTVASFGGVAATALTVLDDQTVRCATPTGVATGPTPVQVSHQHGTSQLPAEAFRMYAFPPAFGATDERLDAVAAAAPAWARDGARVQVAWLEGNTVVHRASADGGATWTPATPLSGGELASEPQVVQAGTNVLVAWLGGGNAVHLRASADGGASFAPDRLLDTGQTVAQPRLAASGDRAYAVWRRGEPGLGTARLVGCASANGGGDWTTPVPIGDGGGNQTDPVLACDGPQAWIAFLDQRDGPTVAGVYNARSTNGGTSWSPPLRRSLAGAPAGAPRLCQDAGWVWLVWPRAGLLEFLVSADGGLSWPSVGSELRSSGLGAITEAHVACERDRLHAIYVVAGTAVECTRISGVGTQPQHVPLGGSGGPVGEPVVRTCGNYVFAAWRSGDVAGGAARLQQTVSVDRGLTFAAPAGFGDATAAQERPQLLLDGSRMLLGWLDHRVAPQGLFTNRSQP
ncbi:MAG: IPT/TIG domain-containing protein [Planctomycetes bacterium]|nr:IPT/TIG domain-containing protein [Planctomycetota bacterium]